LREIIPRDFYWFTLVDNDYTHLSRLHLVLLILVTLSEEGESVLDRIPSKSVGPLVDWMTKNLIEEKIMSLSGWLETAFHLQKQRWDDSIDWLEMQPMSKVLLMCDIQAKHGQEQERQMKQKGKRS
jgi:hypothetical protein